jgi:hypothetical protein
MLISVAIAVLTTTRWPGRGSGAAVCVIAVPLAHGLTASSVGMVAVRIAMRSIAMFRERAGRARPAAHLTQQRRHAAVVADGKRSKISLFERGPLGMS